MIKEQMKGFRGVASYIAFDNKNELERKIGWAYKRGFGKRGTRKWYVPNLVAILFYGFFKLYIR